MSVKIRLKRTGTRNAACYRVVVADARAARDGRAIEEIGYYDPRRKDEKLDLERAEYWLSQGAQPSETVNDIIHRAKSGKSRTATATPVVEEVKAAKAKAAKETEAVEAKKEVTTEEK